jgi:hypothetical protein
MERPRVIVRGAVGQAPLLDTQDAQTIEFYDGNEELVAVFAKMFSDDFWAFSTKEDSDWQQVLSRMGLNLKELQIDECTNVQ